MFTPQEAKQHSMGAFHHQTQGDGGAHRLVSYPRPWMFSIRLPLRHALPLAAIPLRAALLLLALLAFGDKMHFFAEGLRNTLSNHAFVKAADQLLNGFTVTSFYMHSILAVQASFQTK